MVMDFFTEVANNIAHATQVSPTVAVIVTGLCVVVLTSGLIAWVHLKRMAAQNTRRRRLIQEHLESAGPLTSLELQRALVGIAADCPWMFGVLYALEGEGVIVRELATRDGRTVPVFRVATFEDTRDDGDAA